jgi:hypothetical protein
MRTRRRATIEDLRLAIQALPRRTRIAMLEGMRANEIIVGAYTDGHGICPMLAAHRAGGRTNLISFARAWDRFALGAAGAAGGARVPKPRPATARELLVLRTHLEASLLEEDAPNGDLAAAIVEHRELLARREDTPPRETSQEEARHAPSASTRTGDRDRSRELRARPGWSWTRLVRRYDEYQCALAQVRAQNAAPSRTQADDPGRPGPGLIRKSCRYSVRGHGEPRGRRAAPPASRRHPSSRLGDRPVRGLLC